jgi:hypothetical protein
MNKIKYISFILIIILIASCRDRINISVGSTYVRLVIEGEITSDTMAHKVTLTKTENYFSDNPVQPVSNATVFITDGNDTFNLLESLSKPGDYYTASNVYGIAGHTYNLFVKNVDIGNEQSDYVASCYMPAVSKIDSFLIKPASIQRGPSTDKYWEVDLYAKDPAATIDFYLFKLYYNNILLSDTLNKLTSTNDVLFNGNSTNGVTLYNISNAYRNQQGLLYIKNGIMPNDTFTLEIDGVSESYFNFITQMQTQYQNANPIFGGPPANASNNVLPSDKAVGFFAAYSATRKSIIYK